MPAFIAVLSLLLPATPLAAQEPEDHRVSQELREMLTHGNDARSDRAAIRDFLARDDVRRVAAERGIDLQRLESGVATLDAPEARTLADRVNDVEDQLAGGDTFVITSTTIIIVLLVIILIVVA
ncbi:MAG TPA: PA2779 family protein [Longimicrobiales bacterium]|nr:PA2779 family protein [Longimicrobiales bacterium]